MADILLEAPELLDPKFRLSNLYYIRTKMEDENGKLIEEEVHFEPNAVQQTIYQRIEDGYNRVIILKPRKLGVTTGIAEYCLDKTLYTKNFVCRTIAHRRETAGELFEDIVNYSFERIRPELIPYDQKAASSKELAFTNGSRYSIDVEARGLTPTFLHMTEVAYFDDERKMQDTLLSLPRTATCVAESTANGKGNWFERTFMRAWEQMKRGETPEWYPLFFAWFDDPNNRMHFDPAVHTLYYPLECAEMRARFPQLDDDQIFWWDRQKWELGDDLPEKFPSTPEEAFIFSTGKVYGNEFRKEINVIPPISFSDYRLCMDYGQTNPLAITCIHRDADDNFIQFREFYMRNAPFETVRKWLETHCPEKVEKDGWITFEYCDPSIFNETQIQQVTIRPGQPVPKHKYSIADEFKKHKIRFKRGTQNDVLAGIKVVKNLLKFDPSRKHPFRRDSRGMPMMGAPRFFITEDCVNTLQEVDLYVWPKDPSGALNQHSYEAPVKKNDHIMDCWKYTLMSWTAGEEAVPEPPPPPNTIAYLQNEFEAVERMHRRLSGVVETY